MRRLLTVLALPAATLALLLTLMATTGNTKAPVTTTHLPQATADVRTADVGAPVAVIKTNWQETNDGSVIVPPGGKGRPKR